MSRWVVIRRFLTHDEALVLPAYLASRGLQAYCPEIASLAAYPSIEIGSLQGYRLLVLESDADDADAWLAIAEENGAAAPPAIPCPACGGASRRLRRVITILVVLYFTGWPLPFKRRRRICMSCRGRFTPDHPAPFSEAELGHAPDRGTGRFRAFLARIRDIGYDTPAGDGDPPDEPRRRL